MCGIRLKKINIISLHENFYPDLGITTHNDFVFLINRLNPYLSENYFFDVFKTKQSTTKLKIDIHKIIDLTLNIKNFSFVVITVSGDLDGGSLGRTAYLTGKMDRWFIRQQKIRPGNVGRVAFVTENIGRMALWTGKNWTDMIIN